jgi:hypothetical protein
MDAGVMNLVVAPSSQPASITSTEFATEVACARAGPAIKQEAAAPTTLA